MGGVASDNLERFCEVCIAEYPESEDGVGLKTFVENTVSDEPPTKASKGKGKGQKIDDEVATVVLYDDLMVSSEGTCPSGHTGFAPTPDCRSTNVCRDGVFKYALECKPGDFFDLASKQCVKWYSGFVCGGGTEVDLPDLNNQSTSLVTSNQTPSPTGTSKTTSQSVTESSEPSIAESFESSFTSSSTPPPSNPPSQVPSNPPTASPPDDCECIQCYIGTDSPSASPSTSLQPTGKGKGKKLSFGKRKSKGKGASCAELDASCDHQELCRDYCFEAPSAAPSVSSEPSASMFPSTSPSMSSEPSGKGGKGVGKGGKGKGGIGKVRCVSIICSRQRYAVFLLT